MKVAVDTSFFTERDMDIDSSQRVDFYQIYDFYNLNRDV